MNVLLNVYIFALMKKSAPLLPEGTVQCAHLPPQQIHRQDANKNNAAAKVRILVELGMYKAFKDIWSNF